MPKKTMQNFITISIQFNFNRLVVKMSWQFGGNLCIGLVCGRLTRLENQILKKPLPWQQLLPNTSQNHSLGTNVCEKPITMDEGLFLDSTSRKNHIRDLEQLGVTGLTSKIGLHCHKMIIALMTHWTTTMLILKNFHVQSEHWGCISKFFVLLFK